MHMLEYSQQSRIWHVLNIVYACHPALQETYEYSTLGLCELEGWILSHGYFSGCRMIVKHLCGWEDTGTDMVTTSAFIKELDLS